MFINKKVIRAKFIRRPNRFQGYVIIDGKETLVHVPNTGRCKEILVPGSTVVLREESNPLRKTKYDLIGGYKGERFINIDSQIPNKVVEEALLQGKIESLKSYTIIEREKTFGNSRFDFRLKNKEGDEYYLEVKGVTLEEGGETRFPDAPTERGRKHLLELIEVKNSGKGAGVLFLIQMEKVDYFKPNDSMDKAFGDALRLAYKKGVELFAYDCNVGEKFITLKDKVKIKI
ncbi:DNA-binding transcriptional regulator [Clostridium tetanomorphum DSM 665]|uniref:DNA/RNA nuclease SfsA n=1 Tax=Clostridium tetanomorphum TaxID=1553 RepID=UPI0004534817|nr:DNA/RNA nuclease SfsA [Clostridium tetanomorphum]KAJ50794.1 DNA-binding transcriptional regulator [Clostridium tetanomorphum DSM 665]MBP1866445.1 sugar fermentation stimulation protein A [Clostridium tetanomorphum]SQC01786.1 sugar fermentation stimulation protein A [Clostridium tetanomorphum]